MENNDRQTLQYGYQPGTENRGYQPTTNTQNSPQNVATTNSEPPKGGNVAQKD